MKKIILSLGVGLFLWAFATHLKVSVDSPMQLVTEQAMVHATGGGGGCTSTTDCYDSYSGDAIDPWTGASLCCYAHAGWQGKARV